MAIFKRSVIVAGHKTSVSMEPEFWDAFRASAQARHMTLREFASLIDANREPGTNLSSAIRLQVFAEARDGARPLTAAAE